MMQLIKSYHDIASCWHDRWPLIMEMFVAAFEQAIPILGSPQPPDAHQPKIGRIVRVEKRGSDLWGDVKWHDTAPAGHVKVNWSIGPGDRCDLTAAYVDRFQHTTEWDDNDMADEDEFDPEDDDEEDNLRDDWDRV